MKRFPSAIAAAPPSQRGVIALTIVLILLLAMALLTVTASRSNIFEQRITGNFIRAGGVQAAAEGALEYAASWAAKNPIPWDGGINGNDTSVDCPGDAGCPSLPRYSGTDSGDFELSVRYQRNLPYTGLSAVHVITSAIQVDNNSSATEDAWIKPAGVLSDNGTLPPPIVINGGMTNNNGTPDLYPRWTDLNGDGVQDNNEMGVAIVSPAALAALDMGHLNIHNGIVKSNYALPDWNGDGVPSTWEYYFSVTQDQYRGIDPPPSSVLDPNANGGYYWITDPGNWGGSTYGSIDQPAIIVFAPGAGCPKPLGGTRVYGIVVFLSTATCNINGWGNVRIFGSLGFESSINQLDSRTEIFGIGSGQGSANWVNETPFRVYRLPGTWKDWT